MKEIVVNNKNEGQRLDKYLKKVMAACPSSILYKSFRKKNITYNDKKCTGNELLGTGDVIKIYFSDETFDKFSNQVPSTESGAVKGKSAAVAHASRDTKDLGIFVIYEDDDFIFLNKPAGVLVQKAEKNDVSLNEWLREYCSKDEKVSFSEYRPSAVNRIDRNTSGIVMCAKTYRGSRILSDAILDHRLKKEYAAMCHGVIADRIELDGYHVKDEKANVSKVYKALEQVPASLREDAKQIKTIINPVSNNGIVSVINVELITGKSHQIRTHLASIKHPLCGDIKYGGSPYKGRKYQLLHSFRVTFPIDDSLGAISGKVIEAKLPAVYKI